jgi:opacity protein-like surface antigen
MNKSIGTLLLIAAIIVTRPTSSEGQDFFRDFGTSRSSGGIGPVTPSDYSYEDSSPSGLRSLRPGQDLSIPEEAAETDKYNFAIGDIRFGLAVGVGIEYNDNITLSDHDRISDFVFRPTLDLQATWRLSDLNTLRFNLGASYAKYFDHSEFDTNGVLLSPNSELALTFYLGELKFTVRDRFSYQEDAYDVGILSNVAVYGRYENQAGIEMDWAVNQGFGLRVGYDHYNLWTTQDVFSNQDRAIDTIYVKPSYQINPAVKVGVNASYSFINFDSADRSDGYSLLAGPFIEWQLSEFTNLYLEGGYQGMNFDHGSDYLNAEIDQLGLSATDAAAVQTILRDNQNTSTYYIKFEINNNPTESFKHRLSFSKTTEIGFESNSYDLYHVEYNADWKVFQHAEFGPTLFYEHYETSGDNGETANRFGAALGLRYHFNNSLTLGLDYRYVYKDSNLDNANYYQNLALLSLYYKF